MADPMMPPGVPPVPAPPAPGADDGAGKAVLDAYRKALDVIEADPEMLAAVAASTSIELTANDDGSIDVETEAASTKILASELQPSDAGAPPMPPPAA